MAAAAISLRRGDKWSEIEVSLGGDVPGFEAEVGHLLLINGAEPRGADYVVTSTVLRRLATELGTILRRFDVIPEYDEPVLSLLRKHSEEVQARKNAVLSDRLSEKEVSRALRESRFIRVLTKNQIRNLSRLLVLPHGANFSVPGAGKTSTLLALFETLRVSGILDRLLVVCPKNAFMAWEDEIGMCFKDPKPETSRVTGGERGALASLSNESEVNLITYQFLPNVLPLVLEWAHRHKTHIVLDESHRIKAGTSGVTGNASIQLGMAGARRDILTGTPLPQGPEDLRAQWEFVWPGQRILPAFRLTAEDGPSILRDIHGEIEPLYVRTTKAELGLPQIEIRRVPVELGPLQRELYELLRSEAKRVATGMALRDRAFFRSLGRHVIRLLEAASNPMLLTHDFLGEEEAEEGGYPESLRAFDLMREYSRFEKPAKVTVAVERTESLLKSGEEAKVLIWTSFVKNILYLEKLLAGFNPVTLYGAVGTGNEEDPETREGRIRKFHEDDGTRVMIANPAACGESISLHRACHYAIYLDRTFNAAHYMQSVDRIHRLGLPDDQLTRVDILEAKDTIDARVFARLGVKIEAMSRVLNDPGLGALAYDPEDVVQEFPAGVEPQDLDEIIDHLSEEDGRRRD